MSEMLTLHGTGSPVLFSFAFFAIFQELKLYKVMVEAKLHHEIDILGKPIAS